MSSINSSRPKQALGGGGRDSPGGVLEANVRQRLSWYLRLLTWVERSPDLRMLYDGYPKG